MAHLETEFTLPQTFGMTVKWAYSAQITRTGSGTEQRRGKWPNLIFSATIDYSNRLPAQFEQLLNLFAAVGGQQDSFLIELPLDKSTAATPETAVAFDNVSLGTGDGAQTQFQLRKGYTFGNQTRYKTIRKPREGTVVCGVGGSQTSAFSVDTTSGIVTFDAAPGNGLDVTAGFQFLVAMRINQPLLEGQIVDKSLVHGFFSSSTLALVEDILA